MVLEGYMAAPPTVGSFMSLGWPFIWAVALSVVRANAAAATDASNIFFMILSLSILLRIQVPFVSAHYHLRGSRKTGLADCLRMRQESRDSGKRRGMGAGSKVAPARADSVETGTYTEGALTIARHPRQLERVHLYQES